MSIPASNVPELAPGVFTVEDSILIDAPIEKVWEILLDFGAYGEWNAFVRGQKLVTESGVPLPNQTPAVGLKIHIAPIHLPPTMGPPGFMQAQSTDARIIALDHERYQAAWASAGGLPRWALYAERWQGLSVVEGGRTRYESREVFRGVLGWVVWVFTGGNLVKGVRAMAEGLKQRAEGA